MNKMIKNALLATLALTTIGYAVASEEVTKESSNLEGGATVSIPKISLPKIPMPDLTRLLNGATTEAQIITNEDGEELSLRFENVLLKVKNENEIKMGLLPVEVSMNLSSTGEISESDIRVAVMRIMGSKIGLTLEGIGLSWGVEEGALLSEKKRLTIASLTEKLKVRLNKDGSLKLLLRGKVDFGYLVGTNNFVSQVSENPNSILSVRNELSAGFEYKNIAVLGYLNSRFQTSSPEKNDEVAYTRLYGESFTKGIEVRYELTPHLTGLDAVGIASRLKLGAEKRDELLAGNLGALEHSDWKAKVAFEMDFGKVSDNKKLKRALALEDEQLIIELKNKGIDCNGALGPNWYRNRHSLRLASGKKLEAFESEYISDRNSSGYEYFSKEQIDQNRAVIKKIADSLRLMIKSGRCVKRDL